MSSPSQSVHLSNFGKVRLLLWKNFLIQIRHKFHTFTDIALPACLFLIFLGILSNYKSENYTTDSSFIPDGPDSLENGYLSYVSTALKIPDKKFRLFFSPNVDIFKRFMNNVSIEVNLSTEGINNFEQLSNNSEENRIYVAFHHSNPTSLPENLSYSLHFPGQLNDGANKWQWETNQLFPDDIFADRSEIFKNNTPSYNAGGFLFIQNAIANVFFKTQSNQNIPEILVHKFPYSIFYGSFFINNGFMAMTLVFLLSFNYAFVNNVRYIVNEKEKQYKESMKIMGLTNMMHHIGWFIRALIMLLTPMIMIIIILKVPCFEATQAFFPRTNFICLFIFLIGYCINSIAFGFLISAFYSKTKIAAITAFILWWVTSLPFISTYTDYDKLSGALRVFFCFLPNTAMFFGFNIIARWEKMGVGLTWSTAFETNSVYDNLSIASILAVFICNAIFMFLITLYVENIFPGKFGVAKRWNYIFKQDCWHNLFDKREFEQHELHDLKSNEENFEKDPTNLKIGIEIRNLTKKYSKDLMPVDNLSLNIFENQITCLLGQNGAGKTTTMSMLTGMIEPTSGTAFIDGHDIRSEMDLARDSMGFCPQHNILFDELTVQEHILFYSCLKGLTNEQAEAEVQKYVPLLDLQGKLNALSSTLSGGMKRKLSVVIALCGKSKVVFLDEPTSGMDPGARRELWDILLAEKKDRVILLTTHFMDEADVLSDRIAVLAYGELKCVGTTFFLKKRFGTGYHLICEKNENCNSNVVTERLKIYIPEIEVKRETDSELIYLLPEDKIDLFKSMFQDLEEFGARLSVLGFGVSLTTLEEVFLNIANVEKKNVAKNASSKSLDDGNNNISIVEQNLLLQGPSLMWNQTMALFRKRYLCWLRVWQTTCWFHLLVVLILLLAVLESNYTDPISKNMKSPKLNINFNKYKSPFVVAPKNVPAGKSDAQEILAQYKIIAGKSSVELITVDEGDMNAQLINLAEKSPRKFKFQYITGVEFFANGTIVAWFNAQASHSAPLALDLVHKAVIQAKLGENYSIHVQNAPLIIHGDNENGPYGTEIAELAFLIFLDLACIVMTPLYILFYIKEKENNAKFMQYVSGVNLPIFWAVSIVWDLFTSLITIIIIIAISAMKNERTFNDLGRLFSILLAYNFGIIPIICVISLMFLRPATGMIFIFSLNAIIGLVSTLLSTWIKSGTGGTIVGIIYDILWCYPVCTMINAIWNHANAILPNNHMKIEKNIISMVVSGVVAYIVLLLIEYGIIKWAMAFILKKLSVIIKRITSIFSPNDDPLLLGEQDHIHQDEDVQAENEIIDKMTDEELRSETIVIKNVSKLYGKFCAVDNVSLLIKGGQCFGLLGKNGAGKTSIFKMLTGKTMITSGCIFTKGFNHQTQLQQIYKILGYCPQFDALLDVLTCRQMMEIFCMLRGMSAHDSKLHTENLARNLDFIEHIDKMIKNLSGGNKRKVSTSLAIIGNLSVILLDEPTTGMDPGTKRNFWDVIIKLRESGKSIVLTSHSMEECEALCTRMTVLVNGKCKCLGSSQHLKNKFGKGFELKIKVKTDNERTNLKNNVVDVKNFVLQTLPGAIFRHERQGILTYSVFAKKIKWSSTFDSMEKAKKMLPIEDYSVSQNSMEQVVLTLLNSQTEISTPIQKSKIRKLFNSIRSSCV